MAAPASISSWRERVSTAAKRGVVYCIIKMDKVAK
jgi:hypothetical protein